MSEIRLVAVDSGDAQAIESMLADGEAGGPNQPAWLNWRKIWDAGITEDEAFYLIQPPPHGEESHQLWTSGRDKLRAAFDQPVPEDSPDA